MKRLMILLSPFLYLGGGKNQGEGLNRGKTPSETRGFAVVELFTSEGCSSCPRADEAVAKIVKQYDSNVYLLSFHVDYWDRQGWKDAYSNEAYTKRQQVYGTNFHLSSVYTPQAIVNGGKEVVAGNEKELKEAIGQELSHTTPKNFELATKNIEGQNITVSYKLEKGNKSILYIALVQSEATTDVKNGENAGRQLQHHNIVRELKTFSRESGTGTLKIPSGLSAKDCRVIGFLQGENNGPISGAKELKLP